MTRNKNFANGNFAPIGLALTQALILWLLHRSITTETWPATQPGVLVAFYLVSIFVPTTLLLLWNHRLQAVLWKTSGLLTVFLATCGYFCFDTVTTPASSTELDEDQIAGFAVPLVLAWLLFVPLLRGRLEGGQWHAPYELLFRGTWRTCLALAESVLFTLLFWGLLALWAALFNELLGNPFFRDLFADPRFIYPATTLAFALATRIIGTSDRLVDGVIDQVLELLKWLLPLAGLIVVAFTMALLPRLADLLGSGEKVISSAVLLALVAATLLLINAAYRDGTVEPTYARPLKLALRFVPLFLTVVAATALYSLTLRTLSSGLTPARYWGLVTAIFAMIYTVGYAVAALRAGPWLNAIKHVNFVTACLLLITLALSLTPLADPLRWSIASQARRAVSLESPDIREGAMRFLRFDSGSRGKLALESIATGDGKDSKITAQVRADAARIRALTSKKRQPPVDPSATPERYTAWRNTVRTLPVGSAVPDGLEAALRAEFLVAASSLDPDKNKLRPVLVFADLDADGIDEAMLVSGTSQGDPQSWRHYRTFMVRDGVWQRDPLGTDTPR